MKLNAEALRRQLEALTAEDVDHYKVRGREHRASIHRETYTLEMPDETTLRFDVSGLNSYLDANPCKSETARLGLTPELEHTTFYETDLEMHRLVSIFDEPEVLRKPITVVMFNDHEGRVIDGNHRLAMIFMTGATHAPMRQVQPEVWRRFLLPDHGAPSPAEQ